MPGIWFRNAHNVENGKYARLHKVCTSPEVFSSMMVFTEDLDENDGDDY